MTMTYYSRINILRFVISILATLLASCASEVPQTHTATATVSNIAETYSPVFPENMPIFIITPTPTWIATSSPKPTSTPFPPIIYPDWESYTNANYIRAMLIDRDGDLWTGGNGGVVHWDIETGEYVKYTAENGLACNFVTAITQTPDGTLWFGTYGCGLSSFDGNTWKTFRVEDGLPGNLVRSLVVSQEGVLWVDTEAHSVAETGGTAWFDGQSWISAGRGRFDVMVAGLDGTLWAGKYAQGLFHYNGLEWEYVEDFQDLEVTALAVAPDGTIWCATTTALYHYENNQWTMFSPLESEMTDAIVVAIAVEPDGSIWLGLSLETRGPNAIPREFMERAPNINALEASPGMYRIENGIWSLITTENGLADNDIRSIVVSKDGTVWAGSFNEGVSRFNGQNWTTYQTDDTLESNIITTIGLSGNNNIWVGHTAGVSHYNGEQWSYWGQLGLLENNYVHTIHIDPDHTVWFGTGSGVAFLRDNTWVTYDSLNYPFLDGVFSIANLPDKGHLLGCGSSAVEFYESSWQSIPQMEEYLVIDVLVHTDGSRWFTANWDGVYKYREHTWIHYTTEDGLASNYVSSIALSPDGSLWFGTCDGISHFDRGEWISYRQSPEYSSNCFGDIIITDDGSIWANAGIGLLRYDGLEWALYPPQRVMGIRINDLALGSDGAIWIATDSGLSRYIPSAP